MNTPPLPVRLAIAGLLLHTALAPAAEWKVTLRAGDHQRVGGPVTFAAPGELRGTAVLEASDGVTLPVQVDDSGHAIFIAPPLATGASRAFTLKPAPVPALIAVQKADGQLRFSVGGQPLVTRFGAQSGQGKSRFTLDGQPLLTFQMEPGPVPAGVPPIFQHGAHLHPVYSPAGKLVTGDHPADHRWHRGIWFAWTDTDFEGRHPDFWNQGKGDGPDKSGEKLLAEVRFDSLVKSWGGPVQGGFVSQHRFIDHTSGAAKDVLHETWEVTLYRVGAGADALHLIDLVSTQTCAGASPLKLPKYYYGGLGVRGNLLWNPVNAVTMLTSNGDDRAKGDATKAKWVHLGGDVDGASAGLAVLIHPANFRFPQPLRLNPKNPQICIAPSQDGDWSIEPGKPYVSRYRVVVADGPPDAARLERLWRDYAEPPVAEIAR